MRKSIHACEQEGCGGGTWDSEDGDVIGADTNTSIGDQLIECIPDTTTFGKLILWLVESDDVSLVEWPELACRACGAELDGWGAEVKTRIHQDLVDRLPEPPPEISAITTKSPAEAIEWWRSDCSTYLVHLTRGASVGVRVDNIDYEPKIERLSAPDLLWIILTDRTLKAKRGKGTKSSAVCFTEKPLTALKDTVLGAEAHVRRGKRALRWPAYGVMFEKDNLRGLGVRPVIHVDPTDASKLPPELAYRAVTLKTRRPDGSNRQGRSRSDPPWRADTMKRSTRPSEEESAFSVPDLQEPQSHIRRCASPMTSAMSERLREIARTTGQNDLHRKADRMRACASGEGRRCGQASCPRCSVHRSKKYRRRLEQMFLDLPASTPLALITVTLSVPSVRGGLRILTDCIARLRRRTAWSAIVGGEQFIQIQASARPGWFNAHAHMICEIACRKKVVVPALRRAWHEIVGTYGLSGSFDFRRVYSRWSER